MAINKTFEEFEQLNKFNKFKNQENEIDFIYHRIEGLTDFYKSNIELDNTFDFENTVLKGFVYKTYVINDVDYVAIMTPRDSVKIPHTLLVIPIICVKIINVYEKGKWWSNGPDFNIDIENEKGVNSIKNIDDYVDALIERYRYRISFKFHYDNRIEKEFFINQLFKYFGTQETVVNILDEESNKKTYMIYVERIYSSYHNFLMFLMSNPIIYKNIDIENPPSLKKRIKEDFNKIINNFDDSSKDIIIEF